MSFDSSGEEEHNPTESGIGIIEFSPAMAGHDITPANFDFESKDDKKRPSGFTSMAGTWPQFVFWISKISFGLEVWI